MPLQLESALARRTQRKVEYIVRHTVRAFRKAADEYGSLSADEIVAIAANLVDNVMLRPLEKMSAKPVAMRNEALRQLVALLSEDEEPEAPEFG